MKVNLTEAQSLTGELRFAAYACLDTTGTREVWDTLMPRLTHEQARIYAWSRAQLSPAVAMGLRGVRVDQSERSKALAAITVELTAVERSIAAMPLVAESWDATELETGFCAKGTVTKNGGRQRHKWPRPTKGAAPLPTAGMTCERCGVARTRPLAFNPGSEPQVKRLLYDIHKAPKQFGKKGQLTTDKEALQKIMRRKPKLVPLCDALLRQGDLAKQKGFLSSPLSHDGRFHSSFNVGSAWTGRWSSSRDPFRRGGNLQNITEKHRHIFIPDTDRKMGYSDLKTAESKKVAYMAGCEAYIKAHEGDVHTYVCRLVWPELPWNGDIKKDKKIAQSLLPPWDNVPGHDYRFQSKRVQHGSNFGLTPFGMAIIAHVPVKACETAQRSYFEAFPEIKDWQHYIVGRVQEQLPIYNTLRRSVLLMGRPWDGHTHKQGFAFGPQGSVGDVLNLALWRMWRRMEVELGLVECLAQVHDAVLHQFDPRQQDAVRDELRRAMLVPVDVTDFRGVTRQCTIDAEWAVGDNWGKASKTNPNGLTEIPL